ncbi:hypothetical protein Smp_185770 [Schistosoma mansoni]|uniref:hypothetical protein n=1 Tax=Schistosoma mansoni TaxID=6183 RepID=UPI0001A62574|nr:hypothetical protein Smp_185770 [Schistosoma mansoni]|eukprot:XP_018644555.1 hypothetical protein Smp_185770 [Schistosoma mansoni]
MREELNLDGCRNIKSSFYALGALPQLHVAELSYTSVGSEGAYAPSTDATP